MEDALIQDKKSSLNKSNPQEIHHIVEGSAEPINEEKGLNIDNPELEQKVISKNIIVLIVLGFVFLGIILAFIIRLDLFGSSEVKKSFAVTSKMQQKYLPIWKKIYMEEHNMDEVYFNEHVYPTMTDLNKKHELGEQFIVEYEYKIDWVSVNNKDGIIVKPINSDDYLSPEELLEFIETNGEVYDANPIVKIKDVITKEQTEEIVNKCRPNMKPAKKPFKFAPFTSYGNDDTRLLHKAVVVISNNQLGIAEVDMSTGELNCYDADIYFK